MLNGIHKNSLNPSDNKNDPNYEPAQDKIFESNRKIILSGHDITSTSFLDCCALRLRNISESAKEPLCLGLSGGIDSEAVAWLLLREQIPFTVAILKFKNGLNGHDIKYGKSWAQKRNIPIRWIEIDIEKFLNSEDFQFLTHHYQCNSPQIATHLFLAREIGAHFIFAGNPMKFIVKPNSHPAVEFADPPGGNFLAIDRMARDLELEGTSCFFSNTNQQMISGLFAINPFIAEFLESFHLRILEKRFSTPATNFYCLRATHWVGKYLFYFSQGFQLGLRPTKYTGFELLQNQIGHEILGGAAPELERQFVGLREFNRRYRDPLVQKMPNADSVDIVTDVSFREALSIRVSQWQSEWQRFLRGEL